MHSSWNKKWSKQNEVNKLHKQITECIENKKLTKREMKKLNVHFSKNSNSKKKNQMLEYVPKCKDTIRAIEEFKTFSLPPRNIYVGMIMKILKIDREGDLFVSHYDWKKCSWIAIKDFNKIVLDNTNSSSEENQLTPCPKIRVLISGLKIHVQYNDKFGYIGAERRSEGTVLYQVSMDTLDNEDIIVKRKHLKFLEDDGKIDAIILDQCGEFQEYRVLRPNDELYEPILCPKLSQYYNEKFFCCPYVPTKEGVKNINPELSNEWWFQNNFFDKLGSANCVAQLLTENEDLEASSYILYTENFDYITFRDAMKYRNMLEILGAISDSNSDSEKQSVSILSTLKNIEERLEGDFDDNLCDDATKDFLQKEFSDCYVYEEGYIFID